MTFQSAIASTVTVISGILVCIVVRSAYRASTCSISVSCISVYVSIHEPVDKVGNLAEYI